MFSGESRREVARKQQRKKHGKYKGSKLTLHQKVASMAVLTHRLWRLLRGRPKQRLTRLFQTAKCKERDNTASDKADHDHILKCVDEHHSGNSRWIPENSVHVMEDERLIPGLPSEVVIDFILTKLSWTTLYIVSSLNHAWQDVFRSGEVYDSRVRTDNLETLVVMTHAYPDPNDRIFQGVSLYDPVRDAWHLLPPLPRVKGGISSKYECAVVKGKVYIIGGLTIDCAAVSWKAVLMLDLGACRGVWNHCANMKHSRSHFACQVKDNKIYVFGGVDEQDHMLDEAHVYDPAKNSWSQIASMGYKRSSHKAICLNETLYLCGGSFWSDAPGYDGSSDHKVMSQQVWRKKRAQDADFLEMYDSSKEVWLTVENFTKGRSHGSYFVVDECLYHLTHKAVEVYDKQSNSWKSFLLESWSHAGDSEVCAAKVVNGEIFALVLERRDSAGPIRENWSLVARYNVVAVPVKATWSGSRGNHLTWKRMKCPHDFNWSSSSIHPLLL